MFVPRRGANMLSTRCSSSEHNSPKSGGANRCSISHDEAPLWLRMTASPPEDFPRVSTNAWVIPRLGKDTAPATRATDLSAPSCLPILLCGYAWSAVDRDARASRPPMSRGCAARNMDHQAGWPVNVRRCITNIVRGMAGLSQQTDAFAQFGWAMCGHADGHA